MSKMKESMEPESDNGPPEAGNPKGVLHGLVEPGHSPAVANPSGTAPEADRSIEVDENYQNTFDELEIRWHRDDDDRRSMHPSLGRIRRPPRAFDAASLSSTRSLYDSDLDYQVENDRRYVSNYYIPNDEAEQVRMQIMHQVFLFLFKSKLTTVPLINPLKILDIGTGTGDWVIGMGETYPHADVTGTDLSAIQPSGVPPNVFFEIFDAEDDDWTYPEDFFDLIHFRNMEGAFQSWDKMYERVYTHLKPGGWVEVVDFDDQGRTLATFFRNDSEIYAWFVAWGEALSRMGKEHYLAFLQPEKMARAGFVDIKTTAYDVPMGSWPTDPDDRSTAKLWLVACLEGFEAVSLRPLTRDLGWDAEEVRRVCRRIEAALNTLALDKEKAKGLSASVKVVAARKPFPGEVQGEALGEEEQQLEVDEEEPGGKRVKIEGLGSEMGEKDGMEGAASRERQPENAADGGQDVEMEM